MVIVAETARARIALSVYALSLVGLFGASALYHRINWRSVTASDWMRRLDHSMIFVLIAGSYTPVAMLVLHGPLAIGILVAVWAGALLGVAFNLVWSDAPKSLHAALYVSLGWVAVAALPQLVGAIGIGGMMLLASAVSSTQWAPWSTPSSARTRCRPCSDITRSSTPS